MQERLEPLTALLDDWQGILSPADAERAVEAGCDGIIVSNHGGRQLDHAPTSLEMLPAIAEAVNGRIPLWLVGIELLRKAVSQQLQRNSISSMLARISNLYKGRLLTSSYGDRPINQRKGNKEPNGFFLCRMEE